MNSKVQIVRATREDIHFIIETIIEAEKSGTDKISFCNIFSMTEDEVHQLLNNILLKDVRNQELNISDYLICKVDGKDACACTSWVESIDGYSAAVLKANLLFEFVDRDKLVNSQKIFNLIKGINIEREPGTLQIANCYTRKEFRGFGYIGMLMKEHIRLQLIAHPELKKAQVRPTLTNPHASKAYEKIGFIKVLEKSIEDEAVLEILPAKTKVLMEKKLPPTDVVADNDNISIRPATEKDIDFVITTIIEAEKSGMDKIVTANMLGVNESEFREILKNVLLSGLEEYEYALNSFNIADCNSIPAGAMVSWMEASLSLPSAIMKSTILLEYIVEEKCKRMQHILRLMKDFHLKRTPGSIQIEYFYVADGFRGKRIISRLIIYSIKHLLEREPSLDRVEVILMKDNMNSFKALERMGFRTFNEIHIDNDEIREIFAYDTILQMYVEKEELKKLLESN